MCIRDRDIIIRPVLFAERNEVESYLREKGVGYVTDSSNETDDYLRNRLRHNVMPVLKELSPGLLRRISVSSYLASQDESFMDGQAERFLAENLKGRRLSIKALSELHFSIACLLYTSSPLYFL